MKVGLSGSCNVGRNTLIYSSHPSWNLSGVSVLTTRDSCERSEDLRACEEMQPLFHLASEELDLQPRSAPSQLAVSRARCHPGATPHDGSAGAAGGPVRPEEATGREAGPDRYQPNPGAVAADSNPWLSISNVLSCVIYGYKPCLVFSRCTLVAENKVGLQEVLNQALCIRLLNVSEEM